MQLSALIFHWTRSLTNNNAKLFQGQSQSQTYEARESEIKTIKQTTNFLIRFNKFLKSFHSSIGLTRCERKKRLRCANCIDQWNSILIRVVKQHFLFNVTLLVEKVAMKWMCYKTGEKISCIMYETYFHIENHVLLKWKSIQCLRIAKHFIISDNCSLVVNDMHWWCQASSVSDTCLSFIRFLLTKSSIMAKYFSWSFETTQHNSVEYIKVCVRHSIATCTFVTNLRTVQNISIPRDERFHYCSSISKHSFRTANRHLVCNWELLRMGRWYRNFTAYDCTTVPMQINIKRGLLNDTLPRTLRYINEGTNRRTYTPLTITRVKCNTYDV